MHIIFSFPLSHRKKKDKSTMSQMQVPSYAQATKKQTILKKPKINDCSAQVKTEDIAPVSTVYTPPSSRSLSGFQDPCFPDIHENDFKVLELKPISPTLSVAFCGVTRGASNRLWHFCIGTPTCLVERIFPKQDMGTTHDRFLLTPDYYNSVHGSDFNTFLDCIEGVSEKVKTKFYNQDISKWRSPVRSNNGIVEGLQVKVRFGDLANRATTIQGSVRAVVKLSCVYFTPERSGLSFELIDVTPTFPQPPPEPGIPQAVDMDENV